MMKKITETELNRVLAEVAQLFPEIDPGDSDWREFLREFIAARPEMKLDKKFSAELRKELLFRAEQLAHAPRKKSRKWIPMLGMFFAGAAACAFVIMPILSITGKLESPKMSEESYGGGDRAPMMVMKSMDSDMGAPESFDGEMAMSEHLDAAAGTLNVAVGNPKMPMMDESMMWEMPLQLSWDEVPSDGEIVAVAKEFFDNHGFEYGKFEAPFVERWWEVRDGDDEMFESERPQFAPDRLSVVFVGRDGGDVRVDIDLRELRVVWMGYDVRIDSILPAAR